MFTRIGGMIITKQNNNRKYKKESNRILELKSTPIEMTNALEVLE